MKYLILLLLLPSLAFAEKKFDPDRDLVPGEMKCWEAMKLAEVAKPYLQNGIDLRTIPIGDVTPARGKKLAELVEGLMQFAESKGEVQTLWEKALEPCIVYE